MSLNNSVILRVFLLVFIVLVIFFFEVFVIMFIFIKFEGNIYINSIFMDFIK